MDQDSRDFARPRYLTLLTFRFPPNPTQSLDAWCIAPSATCAAAEAAELDREYKASGTGNSQVSLKFVSAASRRTTNHFPILERERESESEILSSNCSIGILIEHTHTHIHGEQQ